MKTLHIHIGTPKTGTTAIQFFCRENAALLQKEGYCYPTFPFDYSGSNKSHNGWFLLGALKDENGRRDTKQEEINFREGMDIVKKHFLKYDNVILSHEGIWRKADVEKNGNKNFWQMMMQEAKEAGFQIHVIVYLRRQDKYFLSNWNQRVKRVGAKETIEEYSKRIDRDRLHYYDKLERISAVIGKENVTVRCFDIEKFEGGTIYSDFLSIFGITLTEEYILSQEVRNTGLYGNMHEIKRVMNFLPSMKNVETQMFVMNVLRECSELSKEQYPCEMYSKEEISEFLESYKEGNQKIAEEYLHDSDRDLFDYTVEDLPKWKKENPYMMDDLIRILGVVLIRQHKEEEEQEILKQSVWHMQHPVLSMVQRVKQKCSKTG